MSISSRTKRILVIASAAVLVIGGGGAAFAYWTSGGDGAGTATTGNSVNFTVASTAATGGPLSPGGVSDSVAFTVTNPADGAQTLTAVVVSIANPDGTAWTTVAGCSSDDYTVSLETPPTYGEIAAGAFVTGSVTVTMLNTTSDQNTCQGAVVPLYFVAS